MEHERDIDKDAELLVELLYGEREVDDAELDETQRAELESLGELRELFRAMPDEEPPNAVSAKLLAAAAQHAPKAAGAASETEESGGFFAKLAEWFRPIVMHPGLAAAASLVLVAGVAGALYVTGRDDIAQPSRGDTAAEVRSTDTTMELSEPTTERELKEGAELERRQPDNFGDDLGAARADVPPPTEAAPQKPQLDSTTRERKPARRPRPNGASKVKGIMSGDGLVPSPPPPPKQKREAAKDVDLQVPADAPEPPKPDPNAPSFEDSSSDDDAPAKADKKLDAKPDTDRKLKKKPVAPTKTTTEAKRLHNSAVAAARKGDCAKALAFGTKIRKLDSRYYDDVFLSDKRIRQCTTAKKKK